MGRDKHFYEAMAVEVINKLGELSKNNDGFSPADVLTILDTAKNRIMTKTMCDFSK